MKKIASLFVIISCLAAVGFVLYRNLTHNFYVKTYLRNVQSISPGTSVHINGVEVGMVKRLTITPESSENKVEVLMALGNSARQTIPADSTVWLSADGVLGPTVLEIDTTKATGPIIQNYGFLNSAEVTDSQAAKALEKIGNVLIEKSKQLRAKDSH